MNKTNVASDDKKLVISTVDAYLDLLPADQKATLSKLRQVIKKAAPEAKEEINYRIPVYKHYGWLVAFSAHKDYLSFTVMREELVNSFAAELKGFKYSGTTIHFTPEKPLPAGLVTKLVKARVAENENKSRK